MEWASGTAELITAISLVVGGLSGWWVKRQKTKVARTEKAAIKTVTSWESTVAEKNAQIQQLKNLYSTLERDYTRSRKIIADQGKREARKDQRIAHLETLLDRRGTKA